MEGDKQGRPFIVSRRSFIKGAGAGVAGAAVLGGAAEAIAPEAVAAAPTGEGVHSLGPGPVRLTLDINGSKREVEVEPRTTLVNVLRGVGHTPLPADQALTGAKIGCDRGSCGACTVLADGHAIYACMMLAVDAVGKKITTVEGVADHGRLSRLQEEMVAKDGYQCGYCTPGFVMSLTGLLEHNPHPTLEEVQMAVSGNTCRCGTYPRIFEAALAASHKKGA